jgi:hypothetical protein
VGMYYEFGIVIGLNPWDWAIKVRVMDRGVKGY